MFKSIRRLFERKPSTGRSALPRNRFRLNLEALEDRYLPSCTTLLELGNNNNNNNYVGTVSVEGNDTNNNGLIDQVVVSFQTTGANYICNTYAWIGNTDGSSLSGYGNATTLGPISSVLTTTGNNPGNFKPGSAPGKNEGLTPTQSNSLTFTLTTELTCPYDIQVIAKASICDSTGRETIVGGVSAYGEGTDLPGGNQVDQSFICTLECHHELAGLTYTQGGWGATANGGNPGQILTDHWAAVYGSGGPTIGYNGNTLHFTSAAAVIAFLPQGGAPGTISGAHVDPTGSTAGVFAGQVLALQLNVDFSNAGIAGFSTGFASLKLQNTGTSLDGQTVSQILSAANQALGGGALPSGYSLSDLNTLVDYLNRSFDNGTTSTWALAHLTA